MRKYFESIPSQPAPPAVDITEPPQKEERRTTIEDGLARLTRLDMVYKTPPSSSPDDDALRVLGTVLSSGRSSRFYENIVRQKQLAPNVSAFGGESRGPSLFSVVGTVNPGKTRRGPGSGDRRRDRAGEGRTDRGRGKSRRRATTRATSS